MLHNLTDNYLTLAFYFLNFYRQYMPESAIDMVPSVLCPDHIAIAQKNLIFLFPKTRMIGPLNCKTDTVNGTFYQ